MTDNKDLRDFKLMFRLTEEDKQLLNDINRDYPDLSLFFRETAIAVIQEDKPPTFRELVHEIITYWSEYVYKLARADYPLEIIKMMDLLLFPYTGDEENLRSSLYRIILYRFYDPVRALAHEYHDETNYTWDQCFEYAIRQYLSEDLNYLYEIFDQHRE